MVDEPARPAGKTAVPLEPRRDHACRRRRPGSLPERAPGIAQGPRLLSFGGRPWFGIPWYVRRALLRQTSGQHGLQTQEGGVALGGLTECASLGRAQRAERTCDDFDR